MLARHEQDIAEAILFEGNGFTKNFILRKRDAQDGIIPGKAAIAAVVHAFVRKIKRSEQADNPAKPLHR
jgi:hypothetical protein